MRADGRVHRPLGWLAALAAAGLALAACGKDKGDEARVALLRARLGAVMQDYPSARFQDVHIKVYTTPQGTFSLACGKVDAKNEFGVFPGFQRFAVATDPDVQSRVGEHAAHEGGEVDYYNRICDYPGKGWSQADRTADVQFRVETPPQTR